MLKNLEKIIFPPTCVMTEKRAFDIDLADEIIEQLQPVKELCPICAGHSLTNLVCGKCRQKPPEIQLTQVGFFLNNELKEMIHQFKYGHNLFYSRLFVELLAFDSAGVEALVPVPLHVNRLSKRGFNQSLELAKFLSKKYKLPIIEAVSRMKDTPQQANLSAKQRKKNLKGAFSVNNEILRCVNSVALVDDVITTNSTINEIAKAIKKQNSNTKIQAWAIAKTPK